MKHHGDLENFEIITQTKPDKSSISHLQFSQENQDHLFTCSQNYIQLWNVETGQALDRLESPPKEISDFKVDFRKKFLILSTIYENTISVWHKKLDSLNFDEEVDQLPMKDQPMNVPPVEKKPLKTPSTQIELSGNVTAG